MAADIPTGEPADLDGLVADARRGEREAFDELVRRTYVDTYTLALRLTANEEDARDVVQEVYLRAWRGIGRFRGDSQFTTWLYRITANTSFTHLQRRRRLRTARLDAVPEPADQRVSSHPDLMAESQAGLEELGAAVEALAPKLRQVVVLKDIYGLAHEEIAEELSISVTAAKVRLHRGRKQLRDLLYGDGRTQASQDGRSARAV